MKKRLLAGSALALTAAMLTSGCAVTTIGDTGTGATSSAGGYGTCPLGGTEGEFHLETLEPDTLVVRADLPGPGWYNGDTVPTIDSGVDYCLLANIAYRSGISKIDLNVASFDALIAGRGGDMDMTANQIGITPAREEIFDFSSPYYEGKTAIVTKAGSTLTAEELREAKLGVKQGTIQQVWATTELNPEQQVAVYNGDQELESAVAAGLIDAAIQDLSIALPAAKASNGRIVVLAQVPAGAAMGVMLPKGSANTQVVDEIIAQMQEDGTLDKLTSQYLGEAYGIDPNTVPAWTLQ